ncbi:MAG: Hsp70 family protein, partial [Ruminococcus sp.]|nr:Hsp70 family protein [Ruminococcus sp.]
MISVGIDLGTTNTVCCYVKEDSRYSTIKFNCQDFLPSALLYERGRVTIGSNAKRKSVTRSQNYIESSKTFMGKLEPIKEIDDRTFNATDVATEILKTVKTAITEQTSEEDIHAVITVPAYFESTQKQETRRAGENAGFIVDAIIHEPSAAAITYGIMNESFNNMYIIDIGGGTFDVAYVIKKSGGKATEYNEEIVYGDKKLGGDDFNKVIYDMILNNILGKCGVDLSSYENCQDNIKDNATYLSLCQKLKNISENVKIALSDINEYVIEIPALFNNEIFGTPFNLEYTVTREDFEKNSEKLFNKIRDVIKRSFEDTAKNPKGYRPENVENVLFMGGSSCIPKLREIAMDFFKKEPVKNVDISKGVAIGASIIANNHHKERENISGITKKIVLQQILSHSLGTDCWRNNVPGQFSEIIKQGSKYPVSGTASYHTMADNQEAMDFRVLEGNSKYEVENTYYADFTFKGITPMPSGKAVVDVIYECDNDGILKVTAVERGKNKELKTTINISDSCEHPLLNEYSETYNFVIVPCFSRLADKTMFEDFKQSLLGGIYFNFCIFHNPAVLIHDGKRHDFTNNIDVFAEQFDTYCKNNFRNSE